MIAKTGTAYGSTTTNATANRTAADHTGHHSVDSRGRSRAAMRTMRTDALTAITSCSLTVATPAGSPPEASSAAKTRTSSISSAAGIEAPDSRVRLRRTFAAGRPREAQAPPDQRYDLPADPHDFRRTALHLDDHLDPRRVVDLNPLLDHERRRGQLAVRREVRTARTRRAPRRGILDVEIRHERPRVDVGSGRLRLERERVAYDLLAELREHLLERPPVRIQFLHDIEGPERNLEGRDPGRGDLWDQAFRADVAGPDLERLGERLDVPQLRTEDRLALRHDDLRHLPALADQLEREDADLEFLVHDRRAVGMRDEPLERRDERRADRRMPRERDLATGGEDAVAVVGRRVRRRKDEGRLGEVHLPRDGRHLGGP